MLETAQPVPDVYARIGAKYGVCTFFYYFRYDASWWLTFIPVVKENMKTHDNILVYCQEDEAGANTEQLLFTEGQLVLCRCENFTS